MFRLRLFALLTLTAITHSSASAPTEESYVITEDVVASQGESKDSPAPEFHPPNVVKVLAREKSRVWVKRPANEDIVGWVPAKSIAPASAFQPINAWTGQRKMQVCTEDYDACISYTLNSDGTYKAKFEDSNSDKPGPSYAKGRLFQYGRIVWAKPSRANGPIDEMFLFFIREDGTLCHSYYQGSCGDL